MNYDNITERRIMVFGDSNTYGYDPERDGRYGADERYTMLLQDKLGNSFSVIEEGLIGRTSVFDDPITEGLNGIAAISPLMMSHAPLDTLVIMLGTNDVKDRFGCSARLIALGMTRLVKKAIYTEAWRRNADILVVCPIPIDSEYNSRAFGGDMGTECIKRSVTLANELEAVLRPLYPIGVRFMDAGKIPGMHYHPLDGMHLTRESHAILAEALFDKLKA